MNMIIIIALYEDTSRIHIFSAELHAECKRMKNDYKISSRTKNVYFNRSTNEQRERRLG